MLLFHEMDRLLAAEKQFAALADARQALIDAFRINGIRLFAFQSEQHGLVAAVALAGGAERAVQLDFQAVGVGQQVLTAQAIDESRGGAHRAHGVGAGGANADLEQVEDAEGHVALLSDCSAFLISQRRQPDGSGPKARPPNFNVLSGMCRSELAREWLGQSASPASWLLQGIADQAS